MAYVPYSPQIGAKYNLVAGGVTASFNDPTDPNYVGMLTEITGLDSAEIRESATDLTEADGGAHGAFYYGRRPITFVCRVFGHATVLERETRIDLLRQVLGGSLRSDAVLSWQNNPTVSTLGMQTWVRQQQPVRVSGGWVKDVQVALVSQYAPLFGQAQKNSGSTNNGTGVVVENQGNYGSFPIIQVNGPGAGTLTAPVVTNNTTGLVLKTLNTLVLAVGEAVQFDTLNHTAVFTSGARSGQSANRYIDFANTSWPYLAKGNNTFTLTGSAGGALTVYWRDAWS